jgi:hypothetical protein
VRRALLGLIVLAACASASVERDDPIVLRVPRCPIRFLKLELEVDGRQLGLFDVIVPDCQRRIQLPADGARPIVAGRSS